MFFVKFKVLILISSTRNTLCYVFSFISGLSLNFLFYIGCGWALLTKGRVALGRLGSLR